MVLGAIGPDFVSERPDLALEGLDIRSGRPKLRLGKDDWNLRVDFRSIKPNLI